MMTSLDDTTATIIRFPKAKKRKSKRTNGPTADVIALPRPVEATDEPTESQLRIRAMMAHFCARIADLHHGRISSEAND